MHEDRLCFFDGALHKLKELLGHDVPRVKNGLGLLVDPGKAHVGDANGLPVVRQLGACAVNYMRHLVGHDELEVLRRELVAQKDPVLYLYSAYYVSRVQHAHERRRLLHRHCWLLALDINLHFYVYINIHTAARES